jgi:hypothetical protein
MKGLSKPQRNAVDSAQSYLEFKGFSKQGLIDQLSSDYGDQYKKSDAVKAVEWLEDNDQVNWNDEAVQSAESYLEFKSFSCEGLIDQLSSDYGDQFTEKQARYGAKKAGAC